MKKIISILASFALASSLFGVPSMAFATGSTASGTEFSGDVADKVDDDAGEGSLAGTERTDAPSDELGSGVLSALASATSILHGESSYEEEYEDDDAELTLQETLLSEARDAERTCAIQLNFDSYLPYQAKAFGLEMSLAGKSAGTYSQPAQALQKKANASNGATTSFYAVATGLRAGTYTMEVSGVGHATYRQDVTVAAGKKATITLVDSLVSDGVDLDCSEADRSVGLQAYGDYDGDGVVDPDDSRHLVEVLAKVSSPSSAHEYDFTGDGVFDLDDIQFFAATVKRTADGIARCGNVRISLDDSGFVYTPGDDDEFVPQDPNWDVDDGTSTVIKNKDGHDIDNDNPVEITIETEGGHYQGIIIHSPVDENGDPRNMPTEGFVVVYPEDGSGPITLPFTSDQVKVNEDTGEVIIDFGEPMDVEKVVITITGTSGPDPDKAEISYIEFIEDQDGLGDIFTLDVPANLRGVAEKSAFTVDWDGVEGATHYLLRITGPDGAQQTITLHNTTYRAADLNGDPIINEKDYTVEVRAMGTNARSAWSDPITVTPTALVVPESPTGLHATGTTYSSISVAWNASEDAAVYDLYYKEHGSTLLPTVVKDIVSTAHTISGLKMGTSYDVYVVARNAKGPSKLPSPTLTVSTGTVDVKVPWYNIINENVFTQDPDDMHIKVIATTPADDPDYDSDQAHLNQVIDGDYNSYFQQDPDDIDPATGKPNPAGQTFEFDKTYPINCFTFTSRLDGDLGDIEDITIIVWDENGNKVEYTGASGAVSVRPLPDADNSLFIMFPESNVKQMQILMTRKDGKPVSCSEVAFYESDHLDRYVDSLFKDETQSSLNDLETIKKLCSPAFNDFTSVKDIVEQLKKDIERTDPDTSERIPDIRYDDLKSALDKAEILAEFEGDGDARDPIDVNPAITPGTGDEDGLSALQPLGVTAKPGDEIEVYVSSSALQSGAETPLRIIATQFDGRDGAWRTGVRTGVSSGALVVGINKLTIPVVDSSLSTERGGALYIECLGTPVVQSYSVRIKGGIDTAALDLAGVTDAQERQDRALAYVNALKDQQTELSDPNESTHKVHEHGGSYDEAVCIANATDIGTSTLLLSLPATTALKSIQDLAGSNNAQQMATALLAALSNLDKNMEMLYAQKGMAREFTADELAAYGSDNYIPSARVNIRYMRYDTAKQLMYAGADHIGIKREYCDLLKDGKLSWNLLHEIGHVLAADSYEIDEVTPSYFALLTTTEGPDASGNVSDLDWPFTYEDVYEHLVKTTKVSELPDELALALMWQLHLAFDGQDLAGAGGTGRFDASLYARMGIFERDPSLAPSPNGIALSTKAPTEWDVFIRLACAASGKNLTPFFDAWGIVYDTTTLAYAGQFQKFEKPIQYVTDQSSQYIKTGGTEAAGSLSTAQGTAADGSTSSIPTVFVESGSNQIKVRFAADLNEADILGYQLTRNGRVCAFIKADPAKSGLHTIEYVDYATQGNINYSYSVCVVDKVFATKISMSLGSVKVTYSGQEIASFGWGATTNVSTSSSNTSALVSRVMNPCEPFTRTDASAAVDGNDATVVTGTAANGSPQFTIRLKDEANVFGLKYVGGSSDAIDDYIVETSLNGVTWTQVATGTFESSSGIVYFTASGTGSAAEADEAHIYAAGHVRLTANGQTAASVAELQLFGPLNDNISFFSDKASMGQPDVVSRGGLYERPGSGPGTVTIHPSYLAFVGDFVGHGDDIVLALFDQDGNQLIGKSIYRFVYSTKAVDTNPRFWVYYFDSADKADADCLGTTFFKDASWFPTLRSVTVRMYRANGATDIDDMILVSEHQITNPSSYQPTSPTNVAPALNYIHNADTPEVED